MVFIIIAHRGLTNKNIKENTLPAFLNAVRNNYDGIELDIRKTKDNKIVVLHDPFINRTSDKSGYIKNKTYKEIKKANFGTKKYKAKIPLLKDVLLNLKKTNILIELKEKFQEEELNKVLKYNKTNNIMFISFSKEHLNSIKNLPYKKGLINYLLNSNIDYNLYDFYIIHYKFYNKNVLDKFTKLKKELFLCGIDNYSKLHNDYLSENLNYIVNK